MNIYYIINFPENHMVSEIMLPYISENTHHQKKPLLKQRVASVIGSQGMDLADSSSLCGESLVTLAW